MKTLLAALATIAALALAPAAHADQSSYVNDLDSRGIYYSSSIDALNIGKIACSVMRSGAPITVEDAARLGTKYSVGSVIGRTGGYTPSESVAITVAAAKNLCPDQLATLQAAANR